MNHMQGATDKDIRNLSIESSPPTCLPPPPPFAVEALPLMLNDKNGNSKIELNLPPMNLPSIDIPDSPFSRAKRGKKRRLSPQEPLLPFVPAPLEVLQDTSRAASPFEELEEESGSIDIAAIPVLVPVPPISQMTSIPQIAQPAPSMALPPQILPPAVMANPNLTNAPILPHAPCLQIPMANTASNAIAISNSNSLPPSISPGISDPLNTTTIAPLADSEVANGTVALPESGYVPLTSTGRLICTLEEWNRRPQMTIDPVTHEMRFRQLRMQCTHCPEAFTKTHDLYAHIRSHQRHTECPHCSKTLTCMATFVYHVRTHTGEKPYYCPVDGCDFTNSVKYNLKVHLACIRHGGKANLAKFAKVLDLDVCDKSIKKRKDNSVHELGSRRSKKRRKLNSGGAHSQKSEMNSSYSMGAMGGVGAMNGAMPGMNPMNMSAMMPGMGGYGSYYNQNQMQQEEYDQYAAQLLYSLSSMGGAYDPNVSALPPVMPPGALPQNMIPPVMPPNPAGPYDPNIIPNMPPVKDETGAVLPKAEQNPQMAMYDPAMMAAYNQNMMPAMPPQMPMDAQAQGMATVPPAMPVQTHEAGQGPFEQNIIGGVDVKVPAPAVTTTTEIATDEMSNVKGEQLQAQGQSHVLPAAPAPFDMQQMAPAAYPPLTGDYAQQMKGLPSAQMQGDYAQQIQGLPSAQMQGDYAQQLQGMQQMQGMQMPGYYMQQMQGMAGSMADYSGMAPMQMGGHGSMAGMAGGNGAYYMNYDQMGGQGMYGMAQPGMGLPMQMGLEDAAQKIECAPLPCDEEDQ